MFARQLEHFWEKKYECSQFQFCSEFFLKWGFFFSGFAFWGKNFLTQINVYDRPKLAYEIFFVSGLCCIFVLYLNTMLVFLYDWSLFSVLFYHSWRLSLSLQFLVLRTQNNEGCPGPPCHALSSPIRRIKWCNSHGSWIMWVMGQVCDGSHGSQKMTHFHLWCDWTGMVWFLTN